MSRKAIGIFVGRSTLDVVYACERFPDPDGKIDAARSYLSAGGPALNAACAFSALGGEARLCSVVGQGPLADWVRQDIGRQAVEVLDAADREPDMLPVSTVIVTGARRAIVNQPLPWRPADLDEALLERLFADRPDVVMSDGHLPELALPVLRRARRHGVVTVLDGGSWKPWTAELLPFIDLAIVSSRFRPPGGEEVLESLRRSARAAAVTDGPRPIRWSEAEGFGEIHPPAVEAVDTLGAGDVFHGAFCHALAAGKEFPGSLAAAAEAASGACAQWGPRL